MLRTWCILIGLGSLVVSPALPDIADVTVNGSISGSGDMDVACGSATPGCMQVGDGLYRLTVSYSFGDTNTALGDFSDSGGASLPSPFGGSVDGFADENTVATPQSLDIELVGDNSADGIFNSAFSEESDSISVLFDLTEPSVMDLSGFNGVPGPFAGQLLDSHGNVILVIPANVGSTSLVLEPGTYQLDASAEGDYFDDGSDELIGNVTDFDVDLHADFTPVPTPEPRWAILAALLSLVLGASVVYRRHLRPMSECPTIGSSQSDAAACRAKSQLWERQCR